MGKKTPIDILLEGNRKYVESFQLQTSISSSKRIDLVENGQHPFATIVCCSDSRVVPEFVFSCGLGELFVIRVAGNVVGEDELASIYYANAHLQTNLIVILGHTHCGAVSASLSSENEAGVAPLTKKIRLAIGNEPNPTQAAIRNAVFQADLVREKLGLTSDKCLAALYDTESGVVRFL